MNIRQFIKGGFLILERKLVTFCPKFIYLNKATRLINGERKSDHSLPEDSRHISRASRLKKEMYRLSILLGLLNQINKLYK